MKPIARRELARLGGVSQSQITKLTQPGGQLAPAVLSRGRGLDADHPKVKAWLRKRHGGATLPVEGTPDAQPDPTQPRREEGQDDPPSAELPDGWDRLTLDQVAKMEIRDLVQRFGHVDLLKSWLDAAKKAADTRAVDLKNDETKGLLIDRELVRTHVFGAMEGSHVRLLGDAPKSITRRVYAMCGAGEPIETAERVVRDMIGSHLKPAIAAARKAVPG